MGRQPTLEILLSGSKSSSCIVSETQARQVCFHRHSRLMPSMQLDHTPDFWGLWLLEFHLPAIYSGTLSDNHRDTVYAHTTNDSFRGGVQADMQSSRAGWQPTHPIASRPASTMVAASGTTNRPHDWSDSPCGVTVLARSAPCQFDSGLSVDSRHVAREHGSVEAFVWPCTAQRLACFLASVCLCHENQRLTTLDPSSLARRLIQHLWSAPMLSRRRP